MTFNSADKPASKTWTGKTWAGRSSQANARSIRPGLLLVFLAPALLLYLGFAVYPVLRTVFNSFHAIKPHGVVEFVGVSNFAALMHDDTFFKAVGNTAVFTIVATLVDVFGGLLLALCLFARAPASSLLRVVWFAPVLISYVVVGVIWVWIYDYDWGLANTILRKIGLGAYEQSWLGHPSTALWSVMVAHIWKWAGFNMIVFLAALYALPGEVLGAAELDNCGWIAKLFYIITPMLRGTIVNLLILSFIGKMMIFDLVWIMTAGGPLWSTETVSTYVYKRAFDWNTFDLGYPSAIAVLWFAIILGFIAALSRIFRQRDRLEF
jgi:raffinose/stachyose/melibiose transport system permease protein